MYQKPESPLSIGGVLDDGFRLLRASFGKVIGLSMVSALIGVLPNFFMSTQSSPTEIPEISAALGIVFLVSIPLAFIIYGAMIARIAAVAAGEELTLGDSLGVGARRFLPLLFCGILYMLAIMGGMLAFVIPGLILMLSLSFALYIVVIDGIGPVQSLKMSHRLVWGNWWRTAAIFTVILFVMISAYILVGALSGVGAAMEGGDVASFSLVSTIVTALVTAIINPVTYAFAMAVLNDLRLRKEGDDLEDRIGAIDPA